ncbi:MAG: ABC transporter permease [Anaerolineae bacterium]
MKKILLIAWKDLVLSFRDPAALVLMLAAPFALTLGMGFVTGAFSGTGSSGPSDIPVVLVNQDSGQLGAELVGLFQSEDLAGLFAPVAEADPARARQEVDEDRAAAAVIIPAGFSQSIIPAGGSMLSGEVVQIVVYINPARPTSAGVIKTVVDGFLSDVEVARVGGQVAVVELLDHGLISPQDAARVGGDIALRYAAGAQSGSSIGLNSVTSSGEEVEFNILAFLAPGMALMFLMFTASNGGRTLLTERASGTLPRLLVSPTSTSQVLGGKVFGTYLTGVAQMLILILASTLLFRLEWGDPLGVLVLVLAAVVGAVGWGMLITAVARTPGQVSAIGSAVMLTFGILGGSFISLDMMPRWFTVLSKITPNAWGLDAFTTLALGGKVANIVTPVLALLVMGGVLFAVAVGILNHRGIAEQ